MTDRTNAERQRRYIARLKAQAANGASNAPPDHAAARIAELEKTAAVAAAEIAALKAELHDTLGARFAQEAPAFRRPR